MFQNYTLLSLQGDMVACHAMHKLPELKETALEERMLERIREED